MKIIYNKVTQKSEVVVMVAQLITNQTNLYDTDYNLWVLDTIELLKAKNWDNLDLVNLIEELENLGKNDFNKVRSLLRQIIIHILVLEYWDQEYERNYRHWKGEIIAFRDDLTYNLTTTLKNKLNQELENIYNVSKKVVIQKTGLDPTLFPNNCPYSLTELLDDDWYPEKK